MKELSKPPRKLGQETRRSLRKGRSRRADKTGNFPLRLPWGGKSLSCRRKNHPWGKTSGRAFQSKKNWKTKPGKEKVMTAWGGGQRLIGGQWRGSSRKIPRVAAPLERGKKVPLGIVILLEREGLLLTAPREKKKHAHNYWKGWKARFPRHYEGKSDKKRKKNIADGDSEGTRKNGPNKLSPKWTERGVRGIPTSIEGIFADTRKREVKK